MSWVPPGPGCSVYTLQRAESGRGDLLPLDVSGFTEITELSLFTGAILQFQRDLRRPSSLGFNHIFHHAHRMGDFVNHDLTEITFARCRHFGFAHGIQPTRNSGRVKAQIDGGQNGFDWRNWEFADIAPTDNIAIDTSSSIMKWLKALWKKMTGLASPGKPFLDESIVNFTPRAQQVLALAGREASRLGHHHVGTPHLLLGLISLGKGVGFIVLKQSVWNLEALRQEVESQAGNDPHPEASGAMPYTPRVKKTLALAMQEAKALHHTYVGTEHILLGLLREGDGVAARVLRRFKVNLEQTRKEILKELDPNFLPDDRGQTGTAG
jgi:hypothetical protein